jgi:hypothetical protein
MKDYLEKTGFPQVEIKEENGNYLLKQKRFLFLEGDSSETWKTPMVISSNDIEKRIIFDKESTKIADLTQIMQTFNIDADSADLTQIMQASNNSASNNISAESAFDSAKSASLIIINKNYSSFFVSNYDDEILKNNLENLNKRRLTHPAPEHSTVRGSPESVLRTGSGQTSRGLTQKEEIDQIHLLHDYEFFVRKGEKDLNDFCHILENYFLNLEGQFLLSETISYLNFYYYFTEGPINEKIKNLLEKFSLKVLEILSKEPKEKELPYETSLRSKAIFSLGLTQNKEILDWSREKFEEFLKNKQSLHPDIKQAIFNNAVLVNERYSENLLNYFQETNLIEEQNKCLVALGILQNLDKLKNIFDFVLEKVRFNQVIFFFSSLSANLKAKKFAFELLKNNWSKLEERGGGPGKSDFVLIRILKSTIPYFGAFVSEEELESFLNQENFQRFEKTRKVVLEKAKVNRLVLIRCQK